MIVSLPMNIRVLELLIRVSLALFFGWSAWQKLADLSAFTEAVGNFQFEWEVSWGGEPRNFFDPPTDVVIAYLVPWFELVAAVALLLPYSRDAASAVLADMLIAFNVALAYAWHRGIIDLNCGCHGASDTPTNFPLKIASNFGLMALIGAAFLLRRHHHWLVRKFGGPTIPAR